MPFQMARNPTRSSSPKSYRFPLGCSVEVRSSDPGFQGAWYEAKITQTPRPNRRRYSITYSTLVAEGSNIPLKEMIYSAFIRPRPPLKSHSNDVFGLHQLVEAFHDEGWWPGVVSKLPTGNGNGDNGLYSVCFPSSKEEFGFKASELRRRLEWVKGKWVSVEDSIVDDEEGVHVTFGEGTQVEISCDRENFGAIWLVGTVVKSIGRTYFLVEYKNNKADSKNRTDSPPKEIIDLQYIRPCPPMSENTSFHVLDEVEVFYQDGWYLGVILVILPGSRYIVKYKHKEDNLVVEHSSLRPHLVWTEGHWDHTSQNNDKEVAANPAGEEPNLQSRDEFSRPLKMLKKGSTLKEHTQLVDENKLDFQSSMTWKSHSRKRSTRLVSVITSGYNDAEVANEKVGEFSFGEDNSSQPTITDGNSLETNGVSLSERQSDIMEDSYDLPQMGPSIPGAKLPKDSTFQFPISSSKAFLGRCEEIGTGADKFAESMERVQTLPLIENMVHDDNESTPCGSLSDMVPEMQRIPIGPTISGSSPSMVDNVCKAKRLSPIRLDMAFAELEDSGSLILVKDGVTDHSELAEHGQPSEKHVVEMEAAPCDTPPTFSMPFNGDIGDDHELISSVLPSGSSSCANNIEETACFVSDAGDNGGDRENKVLAGHFEKNIALPDMANVKDREMTCIDLSSMETSSKKIELPFIKISEMSGLVESAINILPQQPHFRPLLKHGNDLREGLACGLMMAFTSLVTGINKLGILDSEQDFQGKLKALDYLEKHGFNVQPVRARLEKLLEIRSTFGQLEEKKNSMGTQVRELEEVKVKDNLLLSKLEKSLVELEERLASIQEERSSMLLKIRKNESEIADLKSGVQAAEEKGIVVKLQFNASLTAPW